MSEYIFKLPDLGEGTVESEIGEWFIKVGEQVSEEDVVGTMMTDKAAVELSSPVSGTVVKLAGEPGDIVAVGAALVVFETDKVVDAAVGSVARRDDASVGGASRREDPVGAASGRDRGQRPLPRVMT
ncbi:MAG: 2-oxo acid dehydrogenase subunit E2, partial [Desulfobulbaceae bacterium]|nr:2-oxo acid dehydrogenase subunit E2 [Desulfobulbaceae bacterium]